MVICVAKSAGSILRMPFATTCPVASFPLYTVINKVVGIGPEIDPPVVMNRFKSIEEILPSVFSGEIHPVVHAARADVFRIFREQLEDALTDGHGCGRQRRRRYSADHRPLMGGIRQHALQILADHG